MPGWLGETQLQGYWLPREGNIVPGMEGNPSPALHSGSPSSHRTGPDGTCCSLVTSVLLTAVNSAPEPSRLLSKELEEVG